MTYDTKAIMTAAHRSYEHSVAANPRMFSRADARRSCWVGCLRNAWHFAKQQIAFDAQPVEVRRAAIISSIAREQSASRGYNAAAVRDLHDQLAQIDLVVA
jgi:hypothetical protein